MQIKEFNKLLALEARDYVLKDCNLVIDASNFFYNAYTQSELSCDAGCESDKFAMFLKKELNMFKKANVKCYFVFKGGTTNVEGKWQRWNCKRKMNRTNKVATIFVKDIIRQVLAEMGFEYVICQLEAKEQCVVLANKLQCPLLSNYIISSVLSNSIINNFKINFDPVSNGIKCKMLCFNSFLHKYQISRDMFHIFHLLVDETTTIYFSTFLLKFQAPVARLDKYSQLLKWLSCTSKDEVIDEIFKGFNSDKTEIILRKQKEMRALLTPQPLGISCQYLLEKNKINVKENDPQWFEKGIAFGYIAIPYINLYIDGVVDGCWAFGDDALPDAIILSTDIMKYALNLLTNYSKDSFEIRRYNGATINVSTEMVDALKPNYTVGNVVFENGWSRIAHLNLMKHFLNCTLRDVDFKPLQELPRDARLLMITLIYMAHKCPTWGEREAYSVLLSFIALCASKPDMKKHDRQAANEALAPYLMRNVIDKILIYPLFQFQHCLEQMNHLNALCGFSYKATDYSRTYNGMLVYNILRKLNNDVMDASVQISQLLNSAPSVMMSFNKLVNIHKIMMSFKN